MHSAWDSLPGSDCLVVSEAVHCWTIAVVAAEVVVAAAAGQTAWQEAWENWDHGHEERRHCRRGEEEAVVDQEHEDSCDAE